MARKKIVIIGTAGRVGAALARSYAASGDEVIGFNRKQLDLTDTAAIRQALRAVDFEALINCAGATSPDYCERHEAEAFAVNETAVRVLAEECERSQARFIHLSTDYVFGGDAPGLRREEDATVPINLYGRSKLAGEQAALATCGNALVARVSWVFGPDRPGFVEQMIAGALEGKALEAVADKWSLPTGVSDLARWLRLLLFEVPATGLLHLTQRGEPCSWYDYGQFALDSARRAGLPLKTTTIAPQKLAEISAFIAARPVHTAMATERFTALSGIAPRPWQEALEEYIGGGCR